MRNVIPTPFGFLAPLLLAVLVGSAPAQELRTQVASVLAQARATPVADLYPLADELADLAPERRLDSFLAAVMGTAGSSDKPEQRLVGALAL
ncbi:MAG TPA: hypothetical protein ENI87_03250, partial [bacterium]|nr:hypothetical protein [bacterium]